MEGRRCCVYSTALPHHHAAGGLHSHEACFRPQADFSCLVPCTNTMSFWLRYVLIRSIECFLYEIQSIRGSQEISFRLCFFGVERVRTGSTGTWQEELQVPAAMPSLPCKIMRHSGAEVGRASEQSDKVRCDSHCSTRPHAAVRTNEARRFLGLIQDWATYTHNQPKKMHARCTARIL